MLMNNVIPALPPNAVTETNGEILERLRQDLAWVGEQQLVVGDMYRFYGHVEFDFPFWGYVLETAGVVGTKEIFVLVRSNDERTNASVLQWMPMEKMYTRKHAKLLYKVIDVDGPAEDVIVEILQLLREVFEYAVDVGWSYERRMRFYHAFPFDKLMSKDAVVAFRPLLFGCTVLEGCKYLYPESE